MAVTWSQQGYVETADGRVAYSIAGEGERTVLTMHGGPGVPSQYIHSMADLASDRVRVVFYDQLGCGASDKPNDPGLWTVDRFVEEAETVRTSLGLGQVDLWGHSWGGMPPRSTRSPTPRRFEPSVSPRRSARRPSTGRSCCA